MVEFDPNKIRFDESTSGGGTIDSQMAEMMQRADSGGRSDSVPSLANAQIESSLQGGQQDPRKQFGNVASEKDLEELQAERELKRNKAARRMIENKKDSAWSKDGPSDVGTQAPGGMTPIAQEEKRFMEEYKSETGGPDRPRVPAPEEIATERPRTERKPRSRPKKNFDAPEQSEVPTARAATSNVGNKTLKIITDGTPEGTAISLDGQSLSGSVDAIVFRFDKKSGTVRCDLEIAKTVPLY